MTNLRDASIAAAIQAKEMVRKSQLEWQMAEREDNRAFLVIAPEMGLF